MAYFLNTTWNICNRTMCVSLLQSFSKISMVVPLTGEKWECISPSFFLFFLNFILFIYFLYSRFLLVISFIPIGVYMSIPISQFIPPPAPLPLSLSPLGVHTFVLYVLSLFLPCTPVHLQHFSRFHIYALIYGTCLPLSGLLPL